MKAIVIHQFGDPSVLKLEDVSQPTLEAGEIAIKVRAVTVNQTLDVALRAGKYARRPPLPHVLGSDAAGEVAAVAADVKTLKVGDRVVCHPIVGRQPTGALKLLGVDTWGTYADFVKVPANTVQIVPDALDFITAAVVGRHGPLAFTQLRDRAQVKPGEWVLVMGAAGGLGSTLVQAAKHLGARVIAAAGSDERVAAAVRWERITASTIAVRTSPPRRGASPMGPESMSCWTISAIRSRFRKRSLLSAFRGGSSPRAVTVAATFRST
jgi:NADPH:quinone reductase